MILLKLGRYQEGWEEYEWRGQTPGFTPFACPQPRWQGGDISGRTLLVHTEQGAGDALQFARFLPLAAQCCNKLILVCTETLRPLLTAVDGVAEARIPGAVSRDSFDYYCPLLSLPKILGITLENLPHNVPYLPVPDTVSVPRISKDKRLRVGLCWAGSAASSNGLRRSCPLSYRLPLLTSTKAVFYSLQTPVTREDTALLETYQVFNLEPELTDYARTAALIAQLDLVISVDTSIVHLAGALGKPVWVLLGQQADWRWLLERDDSPWYPSLRLFRQQEQDTWLEVMGRVQRAFADLSQTPRL